MGRACGTRETGAGLARSRGSRCPIFAMIVAPRTPLTENGAAMSAETPRHATSGPHAHFSAHDGDAHDHQLPADASTLRALAAALALTGGFAIVEAVGGWLAGSLALLSDAGHMATDAAALGLALFAQWVARRPPSPRASYGYARAEVLAAFVNALALLLLVGFIVFEAIRRIAHPVPVAGATVLGIAAIGLAINLGTAWMLSRAAYSTSAHSALLHVLSDALGSVAAIVAGVVILTTGWMPIDPLLSLLTAVLILRSTWRLLARTTGVLMEGVPAHLDYHEIGTALSRLPGVTGVHDLHVWHMSALHAALSAHVGIEDGPQWPRILADARVMLAARFHIDHVTLQPSWPVQPSFGDRRVIPIAPADGDS
jgi:cobalt-zinc-cadmium efflux system protein